MNRWLPQQSPVTVHQPLRPNLMRCRSSCAHIRLRWWRRASGRTSSLSWTQAAAKRICLLKYHRQYLKLTATGAVDRTRAELEMCKPSKVCSLSVDLLPRFSSYIAKRVWFLAPTVTLCEQQSEWKNESLPFQFCQQVVRWLLSQLTMLVHVCADRWCY